MARRTSKQSKARKRTKKTTRANSRQPVLAGISPQRRKDIVGIILTLVGLLTLISLFTQTNGSVTGWWISKLSQVMGWCTYIFPFILVGLGI